LAAVPSVPRLYDPIFSLNFGIATADLPEFFAQAKTERQETAGEDRAAKRFNRDSRGDRDR
jgi:hypothetical protein